MAYLIQKSYKSAKSKEKIKYWYIAEKVKKEDGTFKPKNIKKLGNISKAEARHALVDYENDLKKPIKPIEKNLIFKESYNQYHDEYEKTVGFTTKKGTFKNFETFARYFLPYFQNTETGKITKESIEEFTRYLKNKPTKSGKPLSNRTINIAIVELKKVLNYCLEIGLIDSVPNIKPLPKENKIVEIIEEKELRTILEITSKYDPELNFFMTLILYTGIRPNEAYSLKFKHIDFIHNSIRIESDNKRKKGRPVPMLSELKEVLKHRIDTNPIFSEEYVCSYRNRYQASSAFKRLRNKIPGLKIYPYMLRRSCASLLASKGLNPLFLKILYGHSSIDMTDEYYINVQVAVLKSEMEKTGINLALKYDENFSTNFPPIENNKTNFGSH